MRAPSGEFDTLQVTRHWIASRADGRKALVLQTAQGETVAFELPPEILRALAADLATLVAQTPPPKTPNA
jgi:hypothetical protein